jgi:biotin carboxyl carrier protein
MRPPPFAILVVHGDGSRVTRLRVPRVLFYGTLILVGVAACVSGTHVMLQEVRLALLRHDVNGQREVIDAFQTRLAAVRNEIVAWKALHAKMWGALDPSPDSSTSSGVGTPASADASPIAGVRPPPWEELDLLTSAVTEEGPRVRELEQAVSRTGELIHALPLRWPVHGPVRSEYGQRLSPWTRKPELHEGIDIGSSPGTPVESPAAGAVVAAGTSPDYGRHVLLDHGNGVRSLYGHLKRLEVKAGQRVEKGQVIGLVGSSGKSTGPHLHYEVQVNGKPVNPRGFLWDH